MMIFGRMATVDDPMLVKFRAALNELYGDMSGGQGSRFS
jgi:hypothetical protein